MTRSSFFFFCEEIQPERLEWLKECLTVPERPPSGPPDDNHRVHCTLYLTGDTLFSLIAPASRQAWDTIAGSAGVEIIADGDELELHGITPLVTSAFPGARIAGGKAAGDSFWHMVISRLALNKEGMRMAGFLLCHGPYISRVPVFALRFLESALLRGISPELYAYLDGVHAVHTGQRPSEFLNIGKEISNLADKAVTSGKDPWFSACSRCSAARGYYLQNPSTGICESSSCISAMTIRNLKEILGRFPYPHPILSHMCGGTAGTSPDESPGLVVFITKTPYYAEWTFGGISLAVAAAMGGSGPRLFLLSRGFIRLSGPTRSARATVSSTCRR
jgi:Uncharacterized conserved protein involved in intracellular sulfur reduction